MNPKEKPQISGEIFIPPEPLIIEKINQCGRDLDQIAELIARDIGLGGAVIKIVNSPAFGRTEKISSIPDAVRLLGVDRVTSVIKTVLLRQSLSGLKVSIDMAAFWRSSVAIANVSSNICRQLNLALPDESYTLGLFHNCGIPVLAARFDTYQVVLEDSYNREDGKITQEEFKHFGVHHAAAGYRIARVWHLPADICLAVKHHHAALRILVDKANENSTLATLICVLKMAEKMTELPLKLTHNDQNFEWQLISETVLDYLGLSEYDFEDLSDAVANVLGEL